MSANELVLAFVSESMDPDSGGENYWLRHLLKELFCNKLYLCGCQLAPPGESQNAWHSLQSIPRDDLDTINNVLSFIPAHALIRGSFTWQDHQFSADFELFYALGSSSVHHEASEKDFLAFLDTLIQELLAPLIDSPKELRGDLKGMEPTQAFEAFRLLSEAYRIWFTEHDLEGSIQAIKEARHKDPNFNDPLRFLAKIYRESGLIDKELETIQEEAQLFQDDDQSFKRGEALMRLGQALIHYKRFDQALEVYGECQALWTKLGNLRLEVQARSNRANLFLRKGLKEEAVAEYEQGLERAADVPEDHAQLLYNLGLAQSQLGQYEVALETLETALQKARTQRKMGLICRIYNARGAIYDEFNDEENLEKALQQYRLAEEYFPSNDEPMLLAGLKDHMAITYRKLGRLDDALSYSEQACKILASDDYEDHRAIAFLNRASLLIELCDYETARHFAQKASDIFRKLQSPHLESVESLLKKLQDALDDLPNYDD
ncbi:MAG: tetratricopeptide repeat protein [Planctomycetota bacterium]|nr:tetratricopeptide repeat protein [Planctomycetota bacterium]